MTYDEITRQSPVVLVEFFASWCPHCQKMMPVVQQVRDRVDGKADIVQLDIDDNKDAADAQNVESIPTFILYKDGKEIWRQSGETDAQVLYGKIESALA